MSVIVYIGSLFAIFELKIVDPELNSHTLRAQIKNDRAYLNSFKILKGNEGI